MHDNRYHIGPNWSARAPSTLREAFPRGGRLARMRGRFLVRLAIAVPGVFILGMAAGIAASRMF